jgi:hypothetical protein
MTTKTRREFAPEFKREAVVMLESGGRPIIQVAEPAAATTMLRWKASPTHSRSNSFTNGNGQLATKLAATSLLISKPTITEGASITHWGTGPQNRPNTRSANPLSIKAGEVQQGCVAVSRKLAVITHADKLDGRIDNALFDRMSAQWQVEQTRLLGKIERHGEAQESYMKSGVQLLELARDASRLFGQQAPNEKRRLLNLVLSTCGWNRGQVRANFRQPSELLAETAAAAASSEAAGANLSTGHPVWLPVANQNVHARAAGYGGDVAGRHPVAARRSNLPKLFGAVGHARTDVRDYGTSAVRDMIERVLSPSGEPTCRKGASAVLLHRQSGLMTRTLTERDRSAGTTERVWCIVATVLYQAL